MDLESVKRYTDLAKRLNVPPGEMVAFIRNIYKDEREERKLQREQEKKDKLDEERVKEERRIAEEQRAHRLKLEEEKLKMEAEKLKVEAEERKEKFRLDEEKRKEKLRLDEEERKEKLRLDEEERKERLRLEEEDKIRKAKAEENERNRQYQLEEIKIRENARQQQEQRELELQRTRIQAQNGTAHGSNGGKEKRKYVIEIGKWKPEITDLNTFLCNFETSATALEVSGAMKALEITRCLEGTALELIQNLSQEERLDYGAIKRVLQQRFRYTEGYYRKQFKTARTRPGESQKLLVDRIKMYLKRWIELSGLEMTVEGLTELFVKDSYFLSQTKDIQVFLKEAGKQNLNEMTKRCENYREAHNIHGEQISFDKRKHNRGVEMDKHRMQKDKPHHNETIQKQWSGKDGHSKGDTRPSTFGYSYSGGAGSHYKPKSGCFV